MVDNNLLKFQDPEIGSLDPQLERQVETIRNLVESYFGIISKNIRDNVPKTIMFMMVNKLKTFMTSDLLPTIYSAGDQDRMMEESQEAARKREEMVSMYHTCKDALVLISDVSSKTGNGRNEGNDWGKCLGMGWGGGWEWGVGRVWGLVGGGQERDRECYLIKKFYPKY